MHAHAPYSKDLYLARRPLPGFSVPGLSAPGPVLLNLAVVETDAEAWRLRKLHARMLDHRRIGLEIVIVPHLQHQIFAQRKGHGALRKDRVGGCPDAVAMRNDLNVMERGDGADLEQL